VPTGGPSDGGGRSVTPAGDANRHRPFVNRGLSPAVWPPIEQRALDFNGVLAELMLLLGEPVRVEVAAGDEHTRAVLCGELSAVGDATGDYASFVVAEAALTLKQPEFSSGMLSVMLDGDGEELRTVYVVTNGGATIAVARDSLISVSA
jgi:hypothetical protein